MKVDEYALVPLADILKPGAVLRNLNTLNIRTLEDCAKAGSRRLLKIKMIGLGTLIALRKECRKRRINWEKDAGEWEMLDTLKSKLMDEYGFSGAQADQICEVYFCEGWTNPPSKNTK